MGSNGELALASALAGLASAHVDVQLLVQGSMLGTMFNSIRLDRNCSRVLDIDQEKCATATENAVPGNPAQAVEAAKLHAQYQIDSTEMNKEMGKQNAMINTEDLMEHTEVQNLTPVYATLQYTALIFQTTSGLINNYRE